MIDNAKLDAIAKEISECRMCQPHEVHVREILRKRLGEKPAVSVAPCPLCGKPPSFDGETYCCDDVHCGLLGEYSPADWVKLAPTGSVLRLPMELLCVTDDNVLYPVQSAGSKTIFAFAAQKDWAQDIADELDGRRVLPPISCTVIVEAKP